MKKVLYSIIFILTLLSFTSCSLVSESNSPVIYLKDGNIIYDKLDNSKPIILKEQHYNLSDESAKNYLPYSNLVFIGEHTLPYSIHISNDNSRVFYMGIKISEEYSRKNKFWYKNLIEGSVPILIDNDVSAFYIDDAGIKVIYSKYNDNNIYFTDLKETKVLISNATILESTKNLDKLLYTSLDSFETKLYDLTTNESFSIKYYPQIKNDDFTVMYCKAVSPENNEECLYRINLGEKAVLIFEGNSSIKKLYDTGELFLINYKIERYPMSNFIEYDINPDSPEYKELKKYIDSESISLTDSYIYYFDGKENHLLGELNRDYPVYDSDERVSTAKETSKAVFLMHKDSQFEKLKLSEVTFDNVNSKIYNRYKSKNSDLYLAINDKTVFLDDNVYFAKISPSGENVYYFKRSSSEPDKGQLFYMDISKNTATTPVLINPNMPLDVFYAEYMNCGFTKSENFYYIKRIDEQQIELWIEDEKLGDNVAFPTDQFITTNFYVFEDNLAFLDDYKFWDENYQHIKCGKLYLYKDGKKEEIDNLVQSFYVKHEVIYYLHKNDIYDKYGTFYKYENGKKELIAENVNMIIPNKTALLK